MDKQIKGVRITIEAVPVSSEKGIAFLRAGKAVCTVQDLVEQMLNFEGRYDRVPFGQNCRVSLSLDIAPVQAEEKPEEQSFGPLYQCPKWETCDAPVKCDHKEPHSFLPGKCDVVCGCPDCETVQFKNEYLAEPVAAPSYVEPIPGAFCPECGGEQFSCPNGGVACANGHGFGEANFNTGFSCPGCLALNQENTIHACINRNGCHLNCICKDPHGEKERPCSAPWFKPPCKTKKPESIPGEWKITGPQEATWHPKRSKK